MYPTSEWDVGCLEDPTFYRPGTLMLGIVSHEHEGVLTLTGNVKTPAERQAAERLAASVPNVKQVVNEIEVKDQPATTTTRR